MKIKPTIIVSTVLLLVCCVINGDTDSHSEQYQTQDEKNIVPSQGEESQEEVEGTSICEILYEGFKKRILQLLQGRNQALKKNEDIFQEKEIFEDAEGKSILYIFTPTGEELAFNYNIKKKGIACNLNIIVDIIGNLVMFDQMFITNTDQAETEAKLSDVYKQINKFLQNIVNQDLMFKIMKEQISGIKKHYILNIQFPRTKEPNFYFQVNFIDNKLNDGDPFKVYLSEGELIIVNDYVEKKMIIKDLYKRSYLEKRFQPLIYNLINEFHLLKKFTIGRNDQEQVNECKDFFSLILPDSLRNIQMKNLKHKLQKISSEVYQITIKGKYDAEMLIECVDHLQHGEKMVLIKTQIPTLEMLDNPEEIEHMDQDFPVDDIFNTQILMEEFMIKRIDILTSMALVNSIVEEINQIQFIMLKKFNSLTRFSMAKKVSINVNQNPHLAKLFQIYQQNPSKLSQQWQSYFEKVVENMRVQMDEQKNTTKQQDKVQSDTLMKIYDIIDMHRAFGHYIAKLDPLKNPDVQQNYFKTYDIISELQKKLKDVNLEMEVILPKNYFKPNSQQTKWTIKQIIEDVKRFYCEHISFDFVNIPDENIQNWIIQRVENNDFLKKTKKQKRSIYFKLLESSTFSKYFQETFNSKQNYGIEGMETFISGLSNNLEYATELGVRSFDIAMSHRGRLNTLVCIAQKSPSEVFLDFEQKNPEIINRNTNILDFIGDSAVHQAATCLHEYPNGNKAIVNVVPNACHLESINPVLLGSIKGKCDMKNQDLKEVMPIMVHGDSSITGQGVVYETQILENLQNYSVGGTVHIILNNQVGVISSQKYQRSTYHTCNISNINQNFQIFVNAKDPEAVDSAIKLAMEYRQIYKKDVFVEIVGFRRQGHRNEIVNEIYHPITSRIIDEILPYHEYYGQQLMDEQILTKEEIDKFVTDLKIFYDKEHKIAQEGFQPKDYYQEMVQRRNKNKKDFTFLTENQIKMLGKTIFTLPEKNSFNSIVVDQYKKRLQSIEEGDKIGWATAEALAYASLIKDGFAVRLTGEDVERGTFSHRHMCITDQKSNQKVIPMHQLENAQKNLVVQNSCLSELGILGYEYGYSVLHQNCLTCWEAQFGDFSNGAQVILDQYIATCEQKWHRQTNIVLMLPHGYDGQGPEHSNTRVERYLQSLSDDFEELRMDKKLRQNIEKKCNIRVVNITNSANYFHVLRQQIHSTFKKPLIIISPKKLLRHPIVNSTLNEFLEPSHFKKIIDDTQENKKEVEKLIFCTGQVYVDLIQKRQQMNLDEKVAIIRLEQLGPFPYLEFEETLKNYDQKSKVMFVQEEHYNFGPYPYLRPRMNMVLEEQGFQKAQYEGRPISNQTATGLSDIHTKQLTEFLERTFAQLYQQFIMDHQNKFRDFYQRMMNNVVQGGIFNPEELQWFLSQYIQYSQIIIEQTVSELEKLRSPEFEQKYGFQKNKILLFYILDQALKNFNDIYRPLIESQYRIFVNELVRIQQVNQPDYYRRLIMIFIGWEDLVTYKVLKKIIEEFYTHTKLDILKFLDKDELSNIQSRRLIPLLKDISKKITSVNQEIKVTSTKIAENGSLPKKIQLSVTNDKDTLDLANDLYYDFLKDNMELLKENMHQRQIQVNLQSIIKQQDNKSQLC